MNPYSINLFSQRASYFYMSKQSRSRQYKGFNCSGDNTRLNTVSRKLNKDLNDTWYKENDYKGRQKN